MAPIRVQVVQTVQIVQPPSSSSPACIGEERGSEKRFERSAAVERLERFEPTLRNSAAAGENHAPALGAERLRAGHRCSRPASCPCATCETALCDESGCPACGRKQLRLPVRDVAAPKTSPCPGSSGSGRQARDARLHRSLVHARPNVSKGERPARSCGMERGVLRARVASFP